MTGPLHVGPPAHVGGVVFTDVWICAALALLTLCAMYVIKTVWVWVAASWGAASTITVPLPVAVDWLDGTSWVLSSDATLATTPPYTLIWPRISPPGFATV